ncbi:MAG: ankyrin repeat protein [Bacillariaceae sp.]|jgi:ankyrin repeat protein
MMNECVMRNDDSLRIERYSTIDDDGKRKRENKIKLVSYLYGIGVSPNMIPTETKAETVTSSSNESEQSVFVTNQSTKNPEWDCLLRACQKNDSTTVRKILREYPLSHSHANPMGQSALHISSFWVHIQCVEILLEYGADVNAVNCFTGATPLHECIQSIASKSKSTKEEGGKQQYNHRQQRIECIKLLLQANAEPYALDAMKRTPVECFLLTNSDESDDIAASDRLKIEKLLLQSKQTTKIRTSFKIILTKLGSKDMLIKLDEIDTIWMEEMHPCIMNNNNNNNNAVRNNKEIDLMLSKQLSDKLLRMIKNWIDTTTKSDDEIIVNDYREYYLGRIAWIWKKIVELSVGVTTINVDEDDGNNDNSSPLLLMAYSTQQNALNIFGMAILERYGSLHSKREQQQPYQQTSSDIINVESSSSLLQDDNILSSWTEAIIILMTEEEFSSNNKDNNNINDVGDEKNDSNSIIQQQQELQQAWMTISRRNYYELAKLWWDQLNFSPIGIVNRQGMTPLQFATRSGHFHLVQYLLQHDVSSSANIDDDKKSNNNISLNDWVQHQDQRGQTALMAAVANQHEEIVQFIQDFTV